MPQSEQKSTLFSLLKNYRGLLIVLIILAIATNGFTLWLPKLISIIIDEFVNHKNLNSILWQFGIISSIIFVLTYLQGILQTIIGEKAAYNLRNELSNKISTQTFEKIQGVGSGTLLTNLTSDIDSVKNFISQAVVNIISSVFLLIGASILLISINWKLGLSVLSIIPVIAITFFLVLSRVRKLFKKTREIIDWLNRVINESIIGAALIRVLNSQEYEHTKFIDVNERARENSLKILKLFSLLVPIITFASNAAILIILSLGGWLIIQGTMTLGEFASFNTYLAILILPIMIISFMSNIIAQAQASYERISKIIYAPEIRDDATLEQNLTGHIELSHVTLSYDSKIALNNVSFSIKPGQKIAIIGPTGSGKTQLLNLLIGLTSPTSGTIKFDDKNLSEYKKESFYKQIGLVFQDSIIFNVSLKENIAFNTSVTESAIQKAITTAELNDFIMNLPEGIETIVSERGTSLSGGQKQRIMLARALAIEPKILLLDDFTARVDANTEKKILTNITTNYPDITLISVTQKIAAVEHYDQIIVLMEGEVVASGTHKDLIHTSPEYVQIYNSQKSTTSYEL